MLPYWILFSISAVGAVQNGAYARRLGSVGVLMVAFALLLLVMVGLRYEVGGDWYNYLEIFNNLRYRELGETLLSSDPGYSVLNWMAVQFGVGIWFVNLICAAIFTWGLIRFSSGQPNPWLALVIAIPYLVIVVGMGYTRQAAAIGFLMAGLATIRVNASIVRFGLYVLAAALFHRTAIIVLPLVALAGTRNRLVGIVCGALLAAMLFYFFLSSNIDVLLRNYVDADYDAQGALVRILMNVLPALIFLFFQKRFALGEADRRLWRNFSLAAIGTLAMLVLLESSVVVDRLALYLVPLQLVVLSRLPYAFSPVAGRPNGLLTLAVLVYSAAIQTVWLVAADNAEYWLPYRTYIEGVMGDGPIR